MNRDAFIDGYVETALWADCMPPEDDPDGELGGREHLEMRADARDYMAADCQSFIDANHDDLLAYCDAVTTDGSPAESYAGHDFWLTRRRHGAGFWDRGLGELGERLTRAAQSYSEDPMPYDCGDGTADIDRI